MKSWGALIALLSYNTWHVGGVRWEIKCAKEERVPVIGLHTYKKNKAAIPPELNGEKAITWS
ncbi:MAG: TIR domain-containing protein [Saprospiraceae bacterium]